MALSVTIDMGVTLIRWLVYVSWVQDLVGELWRPIILRPITLLGIRFVVDHVEILLAGFDVVWRL